MARTDFTLETALPPEACAERLVKATTPMRGTVAVFPFTAQKPMIAKIQLHEFELRKRPFFLYNDTAFAHCFAKFVPSRERHPHPRPVWIGTNLASLYACVDCWCTADRRTTVHNDTHRNRDRKRSECLDWNFCPRCLDRVWIWFFAASTAIWSPPEVLSGLPEKHTAGT